MGSKVFEFIANENERQNKNIELIASENFVSDDIRLAVGSCFTNKYCEGYPEDRKFGNIGRYYGGCENANDLEEYCCDKWREVFHTNYHVNVQPHSGSSANMEAFAAVLKPGDTILAMSLDNGGHLTHGSRVNFSGKLYNFVFYDVTADGYIDYEDIEKKIRLYHPHLILAGASAYSREIDFKRIYDIIQKVKIDDAYDNIASQNFDHEGNCTTPDYEDYSPYFMVDMAHIAGLVATGYHQTPFGLADIITTTTHKTLRGPRGGLIFCRPHLAKKVDSSVFPGHQGGPLMHVIAGKAICAEEACSEEFADYIKQVIKNADAMAEAFWHLGYEVVSNGTDNHMFLLNFSNTHPTLTGAKVQEELDKIGITLNKNCVPNEQRSPKETSGVRIGTPAMTTKGWKEQDFIECARVIDSAIRGMV